MMRVGLVADTHGLVEPRLGPLFRGCALILHAGDVTRPEVLAALAAVAPVRAVRGNNDLGPFGASLPETDLVPLGALRALLVHDVGARGRAPPAPAREALARQRPDLVVHGPSHRPGHGMVDGVLFVNPGSAGPRRFSLPRTAAVLGVEGRAVQVRLYDVAGDPPAPLGRAARYRLPGRRR